MINSDDELINNTINTELVKAISTSGLLSKVYYSPLSDCSIDDNSWVENPENISEMKSFKIELDDSNMSHGEKSTVSLLKLKEKNNSQIYLLTRTI